MKCIRSACALFALSAVVVAASGCGESGGVKVYPVKGTVTYKGKPMVGGGSIALIPLANLEGKTAGGRIAKDGTFSLMTYKEDDGSMPGEFRVQITQEVFQEGAITEDGQPPSKATTDVPVADRIPEKYADPTNSPLKLTVKPEPQENVVIDIPPA
jgi:hypothetical protein